MIKTYKPTSSGQRTRKTLISQVSKVRPHKALVKSITGPAGKTHGTVTSRHRQRGHRKLYRAIDFKRNKSGVIGKVLTIEYDPNRGPSIALISYKDGEKRYILAPEGLTEGMTIMSGPGAEASVGNALPLSEIPLGLQVHNIELNPGAGGVLVRGAGNYAQVLAKEGNFVNLRLPSGEVKKFRGDCYATVGVLTNMEKRNIRLGNAGRKRHLGSRPAVRGIAMADPHHDHPHAGKYQKSGIGKDAPRSPWGWKTLGVKSRRRVHTDYTIVTKRKKKR